ncbi:MAG: glycosyltransferase family 2 protein [Verrucomicrobia bacterium]|nr:glycosyltransferase family 2 protein [Verrucomicrobiota bacterium]
MNKPELSILMAVHNRLDLTRICLASLERSLVGVDYEVLIVDDLSTDGTRDFLETLGAPYRVFLNERKGNFAINNNLAAREARADVLCFLNNDTELAPGWYEPMREGLARFPDAGFIGNLQKNPATGRYDHMGVVFAPWLTPAHYGQHYKRMPAWLRTTEFTPWSAVTAACCLARREVFFAAGGFDEAYVNGCEDIDLCLRMHRQGHRHYVANRSEIVHHKGASPGRKTFNDLNLERLKTIWGDYIQGKFVESDGRRFAETYLRKTLVYPWKSNLGKTWISLRILARMAGNR